MLEPAGLCGVAPRDRAAMTDRLRLYEAMVRTDIGGAAGARLADGLRAPEESLGE